MHPRLRFVSWSAASAVPGYALVEVVVAAALLALSALGVAGALGEAARAARLVAVRDREADIRAATATALTMGDRISAGWQPADFPRSPDGRVEGAGPRPCWMRVSPSGRRHLWIEARCGVPADELPAGLREPGLLVPR